MEDKKVTRRQFMRDGAIVAAGVAVGLGAKTAVSAPVNTSRILNYNQNMEYRRQGKTNLMVSAACLGGHSRSNQKERTEIVSRAIDIGINYIDSCTKGEVVRDARALKGRRDKMYLALSHCGKETRNEDYRTAKKLMESLDEVLQASGQEYCAVRCAAIRGSSVLPRQSAPYRQQTDRAFLCFLSLLARSSLLRAR